MSVMRICKLEVWGRSLCELVLWFSDFFVRHGSLTPTRINTVFAPQDVIYSNVSGRDIV